MENGLAHINGEPGEPMEEPEDDIEEQWVLIQKDTFTNWVNDKLRTVDDEVENVKTDFADGIRLCKLAQVLVVGYVYFYSSLDINKTVQWK